MLPLRLATGLLFLQAMAVRESTFKFVPLLIEATTHLRWLPGVACSTTVRVASPRRAPARTITTWRSGWLQRLPRLTWAMNTSVCAGTGYTPFYLEHGRDPRDVVSRAMDTAGVQPGSLPWVDVITKRLAAAL